MGFAFGKFETESGFAVSHQYDRSPSIIRPGDPVTLRVRTVHGYNSVNAYVLDGAGPFDPRKIREEGSVLPFERDGDGWSGLLLASSDGTIQHYVIEAMHRSGASHYADGSHSLATAKVFAHRVTDRNPPSWTNDAVIYQIFVDRFANADGTAIHPKDPMGWGGGDLEGVTKHLDWIKDLGANCIWITPVFTCQSYHGYDSLDYHSIDPRFGGENAFRRLIEEVHRRDMRILMDIVPNHVSKNHEWFQSARAGGPESEWFAIEHNGSYQTFFSTQAMPKLMLDHPDAREAMIDVAEYWITEFGIDGYRIDHALGPSESFFAALSERLNEIAPDAWLFGEVTSMPSFNRRYGGILDGVTDFAFAYGLREYLAGSITADGFISLEREAIATHPTDEFSWVRFFDNHDMERGLTLGTDDQATVDRALEILMSLPGVPAIFYGTEQALTSSERESAGGLEVGRIPMTFDENQFLYGSVQTAVAERLAQPVDQSAAVWWQPDGSWTWGGLSGDLKAES
jgi:hypothetical protein